MPITIDWATLVITVPQADLSFVGPGVYELDLDWFRLELKAIEASPDGMVFPDTHNHVAPINIGSLTLGRVIEIINGYTVTFEDVGPPYAVEIVGGNSNVGAVTNVNNVSVRSNNSAGLVQVISGSGVLPSDVTDIANAVWQVMLTSFVTPDTAGRILRDAKAAAANAFAAAVAK